MDCYHDLTGLPGRGKRIDLADLADYIEECRRAGGALAGGDGNLMGAVVRVRTDWRGRVKSITATVRDPADVPLAPAYPGGEGPLPLPPPHDTAPITAGPVRRRGRPVPDAPQA